jgi:hypothetical protein
VLKQIIKRRRMRRAEHATLVEQKYKVLVRKPEGKKLRRSLRIYGKVKVQLSLCLTN